MNIANVKYDRTGVFYYIKFEGKCVKNCTLPFGLFVLVQFGIASIGILGICGGLSAAMRHVVCAQYFMDYV